MAEKTYTFTATAEQIASLTAAVETAERAAWGDSNDAEIDALRWALQEAVALLGIEWPTIDPTDEDNETVRT